MSAYVMTYTNLVESIKRWLNRPSDADLIAEIPRMIDSAERKISRILKSLIGMRYVTNNFVIGVNVVQKPQRWLETVSLSYGSGSGNNTNNQLFLRTTEFIKMVYPNQTTQAAPKYYSDYEFDYFYIGPTPDQAYPFLLSFYERPQPLSSDNSTNWLTQNAPDVLLYACLLETAPFLKNDQRIVVWQSEFSRSLSALGIEDNERIYTRTEEVKDRK